MYINQNSVFFLLPATILNNQLFFFKSDNIPRMIIGDTILHFENEVLIDFVHQTGRPRIINYRDERWILVK